jgi:hypothetical protein
MSDGNFIKEGIPLRIGATRCVLGTLRIDPDTVEATNTTTDYEFAPRPEARHPDGQCGRQGDLDGLLDKLPSTSAIL